MKKADNFNPGKWLVENKLTNQSKLNEIERMPDTDYEDFGDPKNQPDEEEADLLAASIMKKGAPIPGYEGQTYMSDTLVGEDGEEFDDYRIYNTYKEAVDAASDPYTGFTLPGINIYKLEDKYAVTFPYTPSKSEFAGKLNEVATPNWESIDEYESILDDYFDTYGLEDPEEFAFEVFDNGDAQNNLAFDIAKRAGFKGEDIMDLIDEEDFNRYCNMLAQFFLLKHGNYMGSISEEEYPEYEKRIKQLNTELPKLKTKAQPTIDQLQGK
jgi:hypothetical protein